MTPQSVRGAAPALRSWLLVLLTVGLAGTGTDLILLEHYEDSWQLVPLFLIVIALVTIAAFVITRSAIAIRVLQLIMAFCLVAGGLGFGLHYRSNAEKQRNMDPTLTHWAMFKKVIRAKAPPALAPAAMGQLGLLGLVFCYRHPALDDELDRMTGDK
jgi:hypothetical protein